MGIIERLQHVDVKIIYPIHNLYLNKFLLDTYRLKRECVCKPMNPHIVLYSLLMERVQLGRHVNKRTMIVEMMWQPIFIVIDGACAIGPARQCDNYK